MCPRGKRVKSQASSRYRPRRGWLVARHRARRNPSLVRRIVAVFGAQMALLQSVMDQHPHPKVVCETGVNGAHSTALFLSARPDVATHVYVYLGRRHCRVPGGASSRD